MDKNTIVVSRFPGRNAVAVLAGLVLGIMAALLWGPGLARAQAQVQIVALTGDQAPGTPTGVTFGGISNGVPINSDGVLAVKAGLQGGGVTSDNNLGFWVGTPGNLQLLVREGDPAVGTPSGVNFGVVSEGRGPTLNEAGDIAFRASLTGSGVTPDNDQGFWVGSPGNLQMVAREGDAAPGTPIGVNFKVLDGFTLFLGANGDVVFFATLVGSGVTNANDRGIWMGPPGGLQLIAREGDPAPGTLPGTVYGFIPSAPSVRVNGFGEVVFKGFLTSGDGSGAGGGIWAGLPGNLTLVALLGDHAPGTPEGVQFSFFGPAGINDNGDVAFGSFLSGPDVTSDNNSGVWAGPPGSLQLVIRQGDPAPGTFGDEAVDLGLFPGLGALNSNGLVTLSPGLRLTGSGITTNNDQGV